MSSDSCLVLHRTPQEAVGRMGPTGAAGLRSVVRSETIRPSSTPVLRTAMITAFHVTDGSDEPSDRSSASAQSGCHSEEKDDCGTEREHEDRSALDEDDQVDYSTEDDATRVVIPQHEEVEYHDANYEMMSVYQRNKAILLSRLQEAVPRGRLSLINLSHRGLVAEDAILIQQAIQANDHLSVLKLNYNNLGDDGAVIIAKACIVGGRHHPHLSVLDLGFNNIGDVGCESIALHCLAGNFTLQTLYLSANRIQEKGAMTIAGAILHGTGLTSLHLSANEIGSIGVKAIAGAIARRGFNLKSDNMAQRSWPCIEQLHLGSVSLDSPGFLAIPGMLLSNLSIKSLCVSNNNVNDNDMILLSQALTQNKMIPLESIHLSFNCITCHGVESLMNAIWGSRTLREVKLDNNRIHDRGAQLCAVVMTSVPLKVLDLSFNRVSAIGIKALMKNLTENSSLESLGLSGIPVDQTASKAVSYALAYNASLRCLYLDNCSTGYASQRHIVAGIVSNRNIALRVLTGFAIGPIAVTLGLPQLPEEWTNDQVLGLFRFMWKQWLQRTGRDVNSTTATVRGPAPPAAVAAAAKIALSVLGSNLGIQIQTELHEKPLSERPPVDSSRVALLERSDSGTVCTPESLNSDGDVLDWSDSIDRPDLRATKPAVWNAPIGQVLPEDNERRNRNLQWLRGHFRSLSDIGRLPFNNADLWQLHQYYFSPPVFSSNAVDTSSANQDDGNSEKSPELRAFSTNMTSSSALQPGIGRAVSFQVLGDAVAGSAAFSSLPTHKRRPEVDLDDGDLPAAKRAKNLKPRIAYYPRIMSRIHSLGTKPMDQTLSLLRQLKYIESVLFAGMDPYESSGATNDVSSFEDVEMILLDLI